MKPIFPPRPKGKMLHTDLPYYESTGKWLAQRKFRGSNALIHIAKNSDISLFSRHGSPFARFSLDKSYKNEILSGLNLKFGTEYWLNGELMNKDQNSTNEIILFDVLAVDRYFFGNPNQLERLQILNEICYHPKSLCDSQIALRVTDKIWMAQTFDHNFVERFEESLPVPQLEGLVLRKKFSSLDNFGFSEYETSNMIRCRKPFAVETPKSQRSGGYSF